MGSVFYTAIRNRTCLASPGLGVPIFNIKAGAGKSVMIREVKILAVPGPGSTVQAQEFEVRFVRNATVFATEGASRIVRTEPQWGFDGAAASATIRMGVTATASATEGGRLMVADEFEGDFGYDWAPARDIAPVCANNKHFAILFHATDTTVIDATLIHEEISRAIPPE